MDTTRIAVPSQSPGGLTGARSEHFGHCDLFTLVDISEGEITNIQTVDNVVHGAGGCMMPVKLLQDNKVHILVVSGMGARPLQGFAEVGIQVFFAPKYPYQDVKSLVEGISRSELSIMHVEQACQGHGDCHHHGN
ncbi:MAG: dinitrogenase iron-molybdenum cofactor biosynthesis protein [Desulfobacterales bacterium]|nr:dinitrogenase iron-molybdenum cofactor biosynthesis protein [Desulfobacterales bacterium]